MPPEGGNGLASVGPIAPKCPALITPRFLRAIVSKGQVNLGAVGGSVTNNVPLVEVDARAVIAGSVEQVSEAGEASQFAGDLVEVFGVFGVHLVCVFRVRVIPDHALIIPEAPRFSQYVETRILAYVVLPT